ncbi:hypothetical protein FNF27_00215 [Cafeteria roenbergensis]|uniref:Large ribosomal subunit protein bL17c n=1 Tax=Cafeteria roenbergensis TaxID=33653 RepID=A0A5A8EKF4_CAFRO|nr:hypothetical protein FNF29_01346 [Cafeteria roenbergensis]KAA0178365.1 hypothetical protein FNF27_00215 [Cafeteria roenbergensis]|eukprot:KAA0155927.1 hypothetical protein FNF29_01346 [Cafeteria roenbergensis]
MAPTLRKLGRKWQHRQAMLRTMATQLIQHERIRTTLPKAKELRRVVDKLVTLGKRGDETSRRSAAAFVRTPTELEKLFGDLAPRFDERQGGYTRVLRCGWRKGDAAPMAMIEFVGRAGEARAARPPAPMGARAHSSAMASTLSPSEAATAKPAPSGEDAADERA